VAALARGDVTHVRRGDGADAERVLDASASSRSIALLHRPKRTRLGRRADDAACTRAAGAPPMPQRASAAVSASLAMLVFAVGVTWAQAPSDDLTVHELAARDDVAALARAIKAGVPVDARDADGQTPLHVAAREGHLFSAMMLLAKGADPNARDAKRRIPLHLAADGDARRAGERYQVAKLLVAKASDLDAVDGDGKRPVDYARTAEFKQLLAPPITSRKASPRSSRDSR
jgi:Ankyrin repeats (3 copies)